MVPVQLKTGCSPVWQENLTEEANIKALSQHGFGESSLLLIMMMVNSDINNIKNSALNVYVASDLLVFLPAMKSRA